jgi:hypothetical protein
MKVKNKNKLLITCVFLKGTALNVLDDQALEFFYEQGRKEKGT